MTRPTHDEYIDSPHSNPGDSGNIRPAVDPPDQPESIDPVAMMWALNAMMGFALGFVAFGVVIVVIAQLIKSHP